MGVPATLRVNILGDARSATVAAHQTETAFAKMGRGMSAASTAMGAFAIGTAIAGMKTLTDSASNMGETLSKIGQIFGAQSDQMKNWGANAINTLGLSKQKALDAAATFAVFGRSAGLTGQAVADFSKGLTGVAADLASFHNTKPEVAINAIGSAMRGEMEPIRQFGILLDDATLRTKALELGLIRTTSQALTPQQKVLAAQAAIMAQLGAAAGDLGRTWDSTANKQKRAAERWEQTKVVLGQGLLPILDKLLSGFEKVLPVIEKYADVIAPAALAFTALGIALWGVSVAIGVISTVGAPVVAVIVAIGALVAIAVVAYQKVEAFRNIVDAGFNLAKIAVAAFMTTVREGWAKLQPDLAALNAKFQEFWVKLQPIMRDLEPWARRIGEFMGGAFVNNLRLAISYLSSMLDFWGWIIDKVKAVIDWLGRLRWPSAPSWLSKIPGLGGFSFTAGGGGTEFRRPPGGDDDARGPRLIPSVRASVAATFAPVINIFVDDPRLKDLIRVEVDGAQTTLARRILAGRAG